jgi:hypothetical protein
MALIVGLATLIALLKAQGMMGQLVSAASGPKAARELGSTFMRGVSYMSRTSRATSNLAKSGYQTGAKTAAKTGGLQKKHPPKGQAPKKQGTQITSKPAPNAQLKTTSPKQSLKTGETRKAEKVGKK